MFMEIPLTSFVDFVLKSGSPKMTSAKKIKTQMEEPYDPAGDYYKRFREGVQELHREGQDKKELTKIIGSLPDSKLENYRAMIAGYKKFLGAKGYTWFEPPRKDWKHSNVEIAINPELGLEWGGKKYIIKLYLKADKPSKDRFSSILALMKDTLPTKNCEYALLDVRNSKLYLFEDNMLVLIPLVEGEAESLEFILGRI
jgi:hypothetical protein